MPALDVKNMERAVGANTSTSNEATGNVELGVHQAVIAPVKQVTAIIQHDSWHARCGSRLQATQPARDLRTRTRVLTPRRLPVDLLLVLGVKLARRIAPTPGAKRDGNSV